MRHVFGALAAAVVLGVPVWAEEIPLPRPRPVISLEPRSFAEANPGLFNTAELTTAPSDCRVRLEAMAEVDPLPRLIGPDACGGSDMVRLKAAILPDKSRIEINPPPELRCGMAESVIAWLRDEAAPAFSASPLRSVENYDSYECRPRNRIIGAKMSEHGKGNALDVRLFRLADGKSFDPTDMHADHALRDKLKEGACRRFSTVLGPGSDGHHESHIHLDVAERHGTSRFCQWVVRDPVVAAATIPLPLPRPLPSSEHEAESAD